MRTEYELWHFPDDNSGYDKRGQYARIDSAQGVAGYVFERDWRTAADGNLVLADALVEQMDRKHSPWLIAEVQVPETDAERIDLAIDLAVEFGGIDGAHHKTWVIDQMVRLLAGDRYEQIVAEYRDGEDGPDTYSWDEGIAP